MKEKLVIRNFGPIKSVEFELSRFNVFIGEQGTGKSTVAKLLAVCRYFSYIIWGKIEVVTKEKINSQFSIGLEDWELLDYLKEDSYISYQCEHYNLTCEYSPIIIKDGIEESEKRFFNCFLILLSDEFTNLVNEYENIIRSGDNQIGGSSIPYSFFQNSVSEILDNPFYIPTERGLQSIYSLGKDATSNMSDLLFRYFVEMDKVNRNFKNETEIVPLNIQYKNIDGKGVIRKRGEEEFLNLHTAASGYQSTIPVVLLMEYYISIRKKAKTFIIEEPELNLFPSAQKELMQYLVDKTMNYGNTMLLTTHSPYVLASLNTMLAAYKSGLVDRQATSKVIHEKYWLSTDDISVFELLSDGTCEDIVDREEKLIKAEKIDVISNTLNEQFEALLNIEFSEK